MCSSDLVTLDERGYAIVERHATTPEKKAEAIEAVRQATEMRWQYMTGLHRAFILKDELEASL